MRKESNSQKEPRRFGMKALVVTGAVTLALTSAVGGTLAWLIAKTDSAVNTFTYGDINITLTETDTGDNDGDAGTNTYEMVPGNEITKDPLITVEADSEDCWLFARIEETGDFDSYITYTVAEGWTALEGEDGVYYREVASSDAEQQFEVIADNLMTVRKDVTKEMLNALDNGDEKGTLTMTVSAYAVQRDSDIAEIDTVEEAWALAQA